ncbi:hypothetical protein CWB99_12605 [Pseudoalteromonas rubra]|uniref:Uncharacterized protein n=1 Tax=Pseudoalteromonas rubra TaxID=43658 RepID=A0A5S3WMG0_9GAMM|nr:hypothetical protein [Pseudoalteromonas rubra]TMP28244.1 hypothetical protein CWB99_12605 [Pseudoalteromonas rubra]TMP34946.1 hypothetical protein CWC00_06235 [Pseudoalteromonas rubra]
MMRIKTLGVLALSGMLTGCGSGSDGTTPGPDLPPQPSAKKSNTVTEGFEVRIYNRLVEQDAQNPEYNRDTPYQAAEEVTYQDIVFGLDTQTMSVTAASWLDIPHSFSLITKAYALSPVPPQTEENIVSIDITSATDFSQAYPSGSNLNALFSVTYADALNKYYTYKNETKTFFTVAEYVQYGQLNGGLNAGFTRNLVLNTGPDYPAKMTFYIEIELDNGKIFSLETQEVTFKLAGEEGVTEP